VNLAQGQQALMDRGFDYLRPDQTALMLNTGKDAFEDYYEWPWLWTPFNGATPLTLIDFKLMVTAASGGNELFGLDLRQVAQDGTDLTLKGTPRYWWMNGANELHAWPGDGATISGVMVADTPMLVNPDDEPLIPARYHGLWIDLGVCEAYKDSDNFPAAQALRADIAVRMQDVVSRYETRNRQHSPFITMRAINEDD
jgi:hypothetical protein